MWLDTQKHNPLSHFINSLSSYDSNIMLAAVISLLVVILFVLLLHIYAKWFLTLQAQRRSSLTISMSQVLLSSRFNQYFHSSFSYATKGLSQKLISSIPSFIYKPEEHEEGLECVICLSVFEENEVGRRLSKCGHCFHIECIGMWLNSHISCPICRAPVSEESTSVEINVIEVSNQNENNILVANNGSSSPPSTSPSPSPSPSPPSLGCSLRRMLSRNRSERSKVSSSVASNNNNDTQIMCV